MFLGGPLNCLYAGHQQMATAATNMTSLLTDASRELCGLFDRLFWDCIIFCGFQNLNNIRVTI
jgi:molybdopterin-guanine dinucleotide biosynthesis protein